MSFPSQFDVCILSTLADRVKAGRKESKNGTKDKNQLPSLFPHTHTHTRTPCRHHIMLLLLLAEGILSAIRE